ncbi:MAG: tetratricopeptide repeat protein [Deltaproteobacteria bacterium]|nr:tetratricopeptide repeat protein [Deltaproteobacteria bacterium]
MSREKLTLRMGWLVIVALIAIAFFNGLHAPFVYDDKIEVVGNPTIRDLGQLVAVLEYNVSRMLLILSYAWNYRSFGLDPFGYHVTSLVIHALCVWSALNLAFRLGTLAGHRRPVWAALAAGSVWAVHPMVTEGVTYITGRSESLCALFVFSTLSLWAGALRREKEQGGVSVALRLLAIFLGFLSMGTKEVAIMIPFALVWMEWLLGTGRPKWRWYVPFLGAIILGVAGRALYAEHLLPREVDRPFLVQISTQAEVWLRYLGLWLLPMGQTLYHHVADVTVPSGRGLGVFVALGGVVFGVVRWTRSRPLVAFALGCAAIFLIPSSSVVALKVSMAEHRSYPTGLYLALALVWGVPGKEVRLVVRGVADVVPPFWIMTISRNKVWTSEVGLWEEATSLSPEVAEAWYGLGDAQRFAGNLESSVVAYETAIEKNDTHLDSWNNLGIVKAQMGDSHGARRAWKSALKVKRTYCKAHANLGFLASQLGDIEDAIVEFRTTLTYCPNNLVAHYGLGTLYADERRNRDRAVFHFEALLELEPGFSRAVEVRERLLELTW